MADGPDDASLLRGHVAGDPQAFAELVRRHSSWMWMTARAVLGDREDAMDAVQLAFIRALRSAHTYRDDGPVAAWLHRIVSRVALDVRSTRARLPTPVDTEENANFEELVASDNSEGAAAERVLQTVVAALPSDQRECFVRIDLLGFTYAEVARDLGIPEGTVKSRRARGKARLVEALREAGVVGPRRGLTPSGTNPGSDLEGDCPPPELP